MWADRGTSVQKQGGGVGAQKRLEGSAEARPPQGLVAKAGACLGSLFRETPGPRCSPQTPRSPDQSGPSSCCRRACLYPPAQAWLAAQAPHFCACPPPHPVLQERLLLPACLCTCWSLERHSPRSGLSVFFHEPPPPVRWLTSPLSP